MRFIELTARQLASLDRNNTLVVVPIAAVEQHGPHLPTGTDTFLCAAIAEALERCRQQQILLTPTVWLGASAHHLRLGATLDSRLETYVATLCEIARSLLNDGFLRIWFLNGHGGNIDPMRMALRTIQPDYPQALCAAGCYWAVADNFIRETLQGEHKFVGHACEFETSMLMHVRPDLVHAERPAAGELVPDVLHGQYLCRDMQQRTREGHTGRPDLASAACGAVLFNGILERLTETADQLLREPLGVNWLEITKK